MRTGINFQQQQIAKLSFPVPGTNDHTPDPFLLVIKAMVCFSASQNCRLMPHVCRPSHFDDTSEESKDGDSVALESEEEVLGIDHVGHPPMLSRFMEARAGAECSVNVIACVISCVSLNETLSRPFWKREHRFHRLFGVTGNKRFNWNDGCSNALCASSIQMTMQ